MIWAVFFLFFHSICYIRWEQTWLESLKKRRQEFPRTPFDRFLQNIFINMKKHYWYCIIMITAISNWFLLIWNCVWSRQRKENSIRTFGLIIFRLHTSIQSSIVLHSKLITFWIVPLKISLLQKEDPQLTLFEYFSVLNRTEICICVSCTNPD